MSATEEKPLATFDVREIEAVRDGDVIAAEVRTTFARFILRIPDDVAEGAAHDFHMALHQRAKK